MKVIASHNGLAAVIQAFALLRAGKPPLEAVVDGIRLVEDDPNEHTVGYGGLPNENGVVELDAAVMDGRTHRGAGVAALQNVRHPTQVAWRLMQQTNRVLLVGEGALAFARANGFPEENLLTDKARRMWLYWKRTRSAVDDWRSPPPEEAELDVRTWFEQHFYSSQGKSGGTVHVAARSALGDLACATSTSGHAFKLPGRVGDSPILGAGLYVDNGLGSCGSIGHGEANLENLTSFAAVEQLRSGAELVEAGLAVLKRVAEKCHPHERDALGRPTFNLQLYLLSASGAHAGVALWGPKEIAVCDAQGARLEPCTTLWQRGTAA